MDFFTQQEGGGFISQYFMAASPHHPLSYYMVKHTLRRLLDVTNIALQNTAFVTGPGAVKVATVSKVVMVGLYLRFYNLQNTITLPFTL